MLLRSKKRYPLILGLGLSFRDQHLIDYWLGNHYQELKFSEFPKQIDKIGKELYYIPHANFLNLQEIGKTHIPSLVVTRLGPEVQREQLYETLLKAGLASLWVLPDYKEAIVLPKYHYLSSHKRVFLIEEDPVQRSLLRQIFLMAGYNVFIVSSEFEKASSLLKILNIGEVPDILYINLDHKAFVPTEIMQVLKKIENSKKFSEMQILLVKDFSIPGFSFSNIENIFYNRFHRIFSPWEVILMLLKSFFYSDSEKESIAEKRIEKIIQDKDIDFYKLKLYEATEPSMIPFLWLHFYIAAKKKGRGILLGKQESRKVLEL